MNLNILIGNCARYHMIIVCVEIRLPAVQFSKVCCSFSTGTEYELTISAVVLKYFYNHPMNV